MILSHPLWKRRFGGDPAVIGRTVQLNGTPHTIVGVMSEDFIFPPGAELWKPLALDGATGQDRDGRWVGAIARLRPTSTLEEARAEARTIARRLELQYPDMNAKWGMRVEPAQVFYGRHSAPVHGGHARVGRLRAADRLRQRREPAARARNDARSRARRPCGVRRDARRSHTADARREHGHRAHWRCARRRCSRSGACGSCAGHCRRSSCDSTRDGRALR